MPALYSAHSTKWLYCAILYSPFKGLTPENSYTVLQEFFSAVDTVGPNVQGASLVLGFVW